MSNSLIKTFAIISHPDAGKTTFTEQLLLLSGKINTAGSVKARKASKHVTSDWMELEKQRGISVSTSVMKLHYKDVEINLLDTPGHGDFSEDTYRTLTAVDSALMLIDSAKGVEERTIKLMEVCRLRNIPIITFMNKLDRDGKEPFDLLDDIEKTLNIQCIPITWPVGMGSSFKGVYNLVEDRFYCYKDASIEKIDDINSTALEDFLGSDLQTLKSDVEMIKGAIPTFNVKEYLKGEHTPIYFGIAINSFGVNHMLDSFVKIAPCPQPRETTTRTIDPSEDKFSGFVFKIQANMDPRHHDRLAFLRIVSGKYSKGMKLFQVRTKKTINVQKALNLFAQNREEVHHAKPGDIIGIHNYGSIRIGDSFTQGEDVNFVGIPNFAPELFRIVRLNDPLKQKALLKGLTQLSEEGATQLFKPIHSNDLILGAIGILQFDVVSYRLQHEYGVDCKYEVSTICTTRWLRFSRNEDEKKIISKLSQYLAYDGSDHLVYLAPSRAHLNLTVEKWPDVTFDAICEHALQTA